MKIGVLSWKSFCIEDLTEAFLQLGHIVEMCPFSDSAEPEDAAALKTLEKQIRETSCDVLFSFNYYPIAAIACRNLGMPYLSWVYDSPYVRLYHYSIAFPTNFVFVFDSAVYLEFHKAGISTVQFLPMAAAPERLSKLRDTEGFSKTKWKPEKGVAFVGSLYTEKHCFYQRLTGISAYTRGYLEGLMQAQKQVYGYNFVQECLPEDILADMGKALPLQVNRGGVESPEYLFAQYVINRQITAAERLELLTAVAAAHGLDLYTPDEKLELPGCTNHGPLDAYSKAPYVYKMADINLNITLRSILNGIPLRAFEIMGAGGFLLTNYQSDFLTFFTPGEDFVFYESKQDLLDKTAYYLQNEKERKEIAKNGFKKVAAEHTFRHRAEEMLGFL